VRRESSWDLQRIAECAPDRVRFLASGGAALWAFRLLVAGGPEPAIVLS